MRPRLTTDKVQMRIHKHQALQLSAVVNGAWWAPVSICLPARSCRRIRTMCCVTASMLGDGFRACLGAGETLLRFIVGPCRDGLDKTDKFALTAETGDDIHPSGVGGVSRHRRCAAGA